MPRDREGARRNVWEEERWSTLPVVPAELLAVTRGTPAAFGRGGCGCPEDLEQDQEGQPETGLGRRGTVGRRGRRRKRGCFKKEETGWGVGGYPR